MIDEISLRAASYLRLGAGFIVGKLGPRPQQPIILYEFEACPFCRRVREALSQLDLEAEIRPCPKQGTRFRPEAIDRAGKRSFPFMIDPNTGDEMFESADIIRHLYAHYGRSKPSPLLFGPLFATSHAASAVRARVGRARPSRRPEQLLHLWSFEASPFCRRVREVMCDLELPYHLHNVAKLSPSRSDFILRSGKMQVPYLEDPNTDTKMFESRDIVAYLERTYAA